MMSGVISSLIRWISSLSISLRFFSRRSVSGVRPPLGIERGDGVVEIPVLALQELELDAQHLLALHRRGIVHLAGTLGTGLLIARGEPLRLAPALVFRARMTPFLLQRAAARDPR